MKLLVLLVPTICSLFLLSSVASEQSTSQPHAERTATKVTAELQPLNSLIGSWRGIGQPRRGSGKGAWRESTRCFWDFSGEHPTIRLQAERGRQFQQIRVNAAQDRRQLMLTVIQPGQEPQQYTGPAPVKWPSRLVLETTVADDGSQLRCTLEQLSDIRLTLLFERRRSPTGTYRRVAGVGYTRSGHRLARPGGNQRECIVTGGKGTIPVVYQGRTWYVCCEGCRQAFDDDPAGMIAAWEERRQQQKGKSSGK